MQVTVAGLWEELGLTEPRLQITQSTHCATRYCWVMRQAVALQPQVQMSMGMPCTQCARSAKFWMSANTRTLVLAPFHKFLVPYQGFCGFPSI